MQKLFKQNPVRWAVELVGGPTRAARLLNVTCATIHNWINNRRVARYEKAEKLGQLTQMDMHVLRGVRHGQ